MTRTKKQCQKDLIKKYKNKFNLFGFKKLNRKEVIHILRFVNLEESRIFIYGGLGINISYYEKPTYNQLFYFFDFTIEQSSTTFIKWNYEKAEYEVMIFY